MARRKLSRDSTWRWGHEQIDNGYDAKNGARIIEVDHFRVCRNV